MSGAHKSTEIAPQTSHSQTQKNTHKSPNISPTRPQIAASAPCLCSHTLLLSIKHQPASHICEMSGEMQLAAYQSVVSSLQNVEYLRMQTSSALQILQHSRHIYGLVVAKLCRRSAACSQTSEKWPRAHQFVGQCGSPQPAKCRCRATRQKIRRNIHLRLRVNDNKPGVSVEKQYLLKAYASPTHSFANISPTKQARAPRRPPKDSSQYTLASESQW